MPFSRTPSRAKRGVLVKMPDGTTRNSIAEVARELGCSQPALYHHITDHADGHAILTSLPAPTRIGVRGSTKRNKCQS